MLFGNGAAHGNGDREFSYEDDNEGVERVDPACGEGDPFRSSAKASLPVVSSTETNATNNEYLAVRRAIARQKRQQKERRDRLDVEYEA